MTDLDTGTSSIRDDSICESSLPPNKSSGDIVERLRAIPDYLMILPTIGMPDQVTVGALAHESAAEIERLRREVENLTLRNSNLEEQRDSHAARASAIRSAVSKKTAESGHSPSTRERE